MSSLSFISNILYNESLKDFIKSFLNSVQKQGLDENLDGINSQSEINKDKFSEIVKIILTIFWRLVSNSVVRF